MEPFYPLRAYVCARCRLVQLEQFESPEEIFSDYAYFSSFSTSWLDALAAATSSDGGPARAGRRQPGRRDRLQRRLPAAVLSRRAGSRCSASSRPPTSPRVAIERGIPTRVEFFGVATATALRAERGADLLLGNNVLAHVPDLNDFVAGMKVLLNDGRHDHDGVPPPATADRRAAVGHDLPRALLVLLVAHGAPRSSRPTGLRLFDVEELPTHGGSLRIFGCHEDDAARGDRARVASSRTASAPPGSSELDDLRGVRGTRSPRTSSRSSAFLIGLRREGLRIAGYGAPAKGNTMLNYCGVGPEIVEFMCDLNPHKQGHLLPGSRIPIHDPEALRERASRRRPDPALEPARGDRRAARVRRASGVDASLRARPTLRLLG